MSRPVVLSLASLRSRSDACVPSSQVLSLQGSAHHTRPAADDASCQSVHAHLAAAEWEPVPADKLGDRRARLQEERPVSVQASRTRCCGRHPSLSLSNLSLSALAQTRSRTCLSPYERTLRRAQRRCFPSRRPTTGSRRCSSAEDPTCDPTSGSQTGTSQGESSPVHSHSRRAVGG